ncbi:Ger(x)C family spore germination protein [Aneurinibacillus sp. Ricciae_BoGa-3]|uniref:Ger(x)C family spore germination protein n=1 Tax=Aneurinibacillus sp. Ricciae_BoGa-3 TaxID=3022697 RepID=UPI0023424DA7|nr:Ger(x)C family spore germination protein [Aneurinibacillus sp. Ricciae_BoGa-3]WCK55676.1 Ger(x)C family spore germination protein [Aneurinibacillus sp. Ricciae_BoGa-3]
MRTKWVIPTVLLVGMVLLLPGCWDSRDLKELAVVVAMGVDQAPKTNEYRVSFQVVNPSAVAPSSIGGGTGGNVTAVTVFTGTGKNLFEAIRKTSQKVPRRLFFAHIQILVIGENLARKGINELFDLFDRNHEARSTAMVLVARGANAESILSTLTSVEKIPANALIGKINRTSEVWSESANIKIDDVVKALTSKGSQPIISGVKLVGDPKKGRSKSNVEKTELPTLLEIKGIALFKNGKLKRWLDGEKARGTLWIQNKMKSTVVNVDCKDKKDAIGIQLIRSKTGVTAEVQAMKPIIHIHIREEGNVGEVKCPIDISKPEEITKLEKEWERETMKEVMKAVDVAQREKSDIFGFGDEVRRADPKAWGKMKNKWSEVFAQSKVDVHVDAFIRLPGMQTKPSMLTQRQD